MDKCSITEQEVDQDADLDMDVNQHHDFDDDSDEVQKAEDDLDQENIPVLWDQRTEEDGTCDVAESDLISFAYQLADGMVCVYDSFIIHLNSLWILHHVYSSCTLSPSPAIPVLAGCFTSRPGL